jgi:ATP-dependent Clp protease, protease subunit
MATPPTAAVTPDVFAVFADDINQQGAARIVQGITHVMGAGHKHAHVMFHSWGGFVGDGVMLYNFFSALSSLELSLYNSGQVSSAAITAYLGAKRRVASPRSLFMLHKSHTSPQFATADKLDRLARNLVLDDERSEDIWRQHLKMPDELWKQLEFHDIYLTAEEAAKYGLATEIGEFSPPPGMQIYRV